MANNYTTTTAAQSNKAIRLQKFGTTFFDFMSSLQRRFPKHAVVKQYLDNRDRLDMKKQQRWFRRKTMNLADSINRRDEAMFDQPGLNPEWFSGIDMKKLYQDLDEKQRESFWLYMNCFVLLSHPKNAHLENTIRQNLQQYIANAQSQTSGGGNGEHTGGSSGEVTHEDSGVTHEDSGNLVQNMFGMLFENKQLMSMLDTACNAIADNGDAIKTDDIDKILPTNGTAGTMVKDMFADLTSNLKSKRESGEKIDFKSLVNLDLAQSIGQKYGEKIASGDINIQGMMTDMMQSLNNMPEMQGGAPPGMPELNNLTSMLTGVLNSQSGDDAATMPDIHQMTNMLQNMLNSTKQ